MTTAVVVAATVVVWVHALSLCGLLLITLLTAWRGPGPVTPDRLAAHPATVPLALVFLWSVWPFRAVLAAGVVGSLLNGDTGQAVWQTVVLAVHLWAGSKGTGGRGRRAVKRVAARVREVAGRLVVTPTPTRA